MNFGSESRAKILDLQEGMHRSVHSQLPSIGIERIVGVIKTSKLDEILEIAVGASPPCLILVRHS